MGLIKLFELNWRFTVWANTLPLFKSQHKRSIQRWSWGCLLFTASSLGDVTHCRFKIWASWKKRLCHSWKTWKTRSKLNFVQTMGQRPSLSQSCRKEPVIARSSTLGVLGKQKCLKNCDFLYRKGHSFSWLTFSIPPLQNCKSLIIQH